MKLSADSILKSKTISKKEICYLLGLYYSDGRPAYGQLTRQYFTDPVLVDLGLTKEQFKKTRIFDSVKTKIIIGKFQLDLVAPSLKLLLN